MSRNSKTPWFLIGALMFLGATRANATIVFQTGNNPQNNEENILFNGLGQVAGPALTVTGATQTGFVFDFTGLENLVTPSNGQARIEAQDGAFRNLLIFSPGDTFTDLIFNLNTPNSTASTANITVNSIGGAGGTFALPVNQGQNFLTIVASGGEKITSVSIASLVDINDIRQVRVSGPAAVPEPAAVGLVGASLLALAAFRRRLLR